jgi:hypothetical protein
MNLEGKDHRRQGRSFLLGSRFGAEARERHFKLMATSSKRNAEFCQACSGSEIKGLPICLWGGFGLPKGGDVFYFVAFRSSYPLAGCSPAEPAFVSLDDQSLTVCPKGSRVGPLARATHRRKPSASYLFEAAGEFAALVRGTSPRLMPRTALPTNTTH